MKFEDLDLNKTYTYADYLGWFFHERIELIKGKVFKMFPSPNTYHQDISTNLVLGLGYFFASRNCKVYHAPFDVRFPLDPEMISNEEIVTVVQPDICVICDKNKIDMKGCLGAPDWIIEIASPSTSKKDQTHKFQLYESNGVREYWMVFPEEKKVLVNFLDQDEKYVQLDPFFKEDKISPVLFPELTIDLSSIFPELNLSEKSWEGEYVRL